MNAGLNISKINNILNISKRFLWEANTSCPNLPHLVEGNTFDGHCENSPQQSRVKKGVLPVQTSSSQLIDFMGCFIFFYLLYPW